MEEIKKVFKNSKVKWTICILGCLVVALIIFQAGMFVGFKKAGFSFRTGEQYFRQMGGRPDDQFMGMNIGDFTNSHGAIGKILTIKLPAIIVSDRDNVEKTIIVSTSTDIRQMKNKITAQDLKINDFITVIGEPNANAEIDAKLIRVMPTPENLPINSTSTTK
jgi:hypothetical protein